MDGMSNYSGILKQRNFGFGEVVNVQEDMEVEEQFVQLVVGWFV